MTDKKNDNNNGQLSKKYQSKKMIVVSGIS